MSFLEFVCRRLLGEPSRYEGRNPLWECLACGRVKLHCRPPSDHYKERVACWVCDFHEDAAGLWKLKHPGRYYRDAVDALDAWRKEWEQAEQEARKTARPTEGRAQGISSGGMASGGAVRGRVTYNWGDVQRAFADLSGAEMLQLCWDSERLAFLADLAAECRTFLEWCEQMDRMHREECRDPDCDAAVCRVARGLPPLTSEQIEADALMRRRTVPNRRSIPYAAESPQSG